jgi:hypothetical protein
MEQPGAGVGSGHLEREHPRGLGGMEVGTTPWHTDSAVEVSSVFQEGSGGLGADSLLPYSDWIWAPVSNSELVWTV